MRATVAGAFCLWSCSLHAQGIAGDPNRYCKEVSGYGPASVKVSICVNDWNGTTASNGDLLVVARSQSDKKLVVDFKCRTGFSRKKEGDFQESRDFGSLTLAPSGTGFSIILPQLSRADRLSWKTFSTDECQWSVEEISDSSDVQTKVQRPDDQRSEQSFQREIEAEQAKTDRHFLDCDAKEQDCKARYKAMFSGCKTVCRSEDDGDCNPCLDASSRLRRACSAANQACIDNDQRRYQSAMDRVEHEEARQPRNSQPAASSTNSDDDGGFNAEYITRFGDDQNTVPAPPAAKGPSTWGKSGISGPSRDYGKGSAQPSKSAQ